MTEKQIRNQLYLISESTLQIDNLCELWEEDLYNLEDYSYVVECDTGYLYHISKKQ